MVSAKAATALVLLASTGSALAAGSTGTFQTGMDAATMTTLGKLTGCDKVCFGTELYVASGTSQANVMGKGSATCTCETVTLDLVAGGIAPFTGKMFSKGGVALGGSGALKTTSDSGSGGGSTGTTTKGGSAGGKTTTKAMTTTTTTTATPTPTNSDVTARRRREIFARTVGDSLTISLTGLGDILFSKTSDSAPAGVSVPGAASKILASGAAILSAGVAAVVAGFVAL